MDTDFYTFFNVTSLGLLSDCQFDNEFRLGVSYGDDVCEYMQNPNINCKQCIKSNQKYPCYPPIDYFILLQLVLSFGIPSQINMDDLIKQKDDILNYIKGCDKDKVRNLLNSCVKRYMYY